MSKKAEDSNTEKIVKKKVEKKPAKTDASEKVSDSISIKKANLEVVKKCVHNLKFPHRVLSAEEKIQLFADLKVGFENLPKIKDSDPMLNGLGAVPGDVIEIRRKESFGECNYYRGVVRTNQS